MGSCCSSDSTKIITVTRKPELTYNQGKSNDKPLSPEDVRINKFQIESRRLEMAAQYDKKLSQDKYKNISKQGQIGKNNTLIQI